MGMIWNIRGGLGTQILEYLACVHLTDWEGGDVIETLNVVARSGDRASIRRLHVDDLLYADVAMCVVPNGSKMGVWRGDLLQRVFADRARILPHATLAVTPIRTERLMHVRLGDRAPVTARRYIDAAGSQDWDVVGDHDQPGREIAQSINGRWVGSDSQADWQRCLGAGEILGPPSSFTISALFYQPHMRLRVLRHQDGPCPVPAYMLDAIDGIRRWCPNIEWVR
jgi:hypothetical protein